MNVLDEVAVREQPPMWMLSGEQSEPSILISFHVLSGNRKMCKVRVMEDVPRQRIRLLYRVEYYGSQSVALEIKRAIGQRLVDPYNPIALLSTFGGYAPGVTLMAPGLPQDLVH